MDWIDMLEDFDVVVSRDRRGNESKKVYIKDRLYDIGDGFAHEYVQDMIDRDELITGIYREFKGIEGDGDYLLGFALAGRIDSMNRIYPKVENYVARIRFTGDSGIYRNKISRKLWDSIRDDYENIKYVLVVDKQDNKEIAELVNVLEVEAKDFEWEVMNIVVL